MRAGYFALSLGMIMLLWGLFIATQANEERQYFGDRIESRIHNPDEGIPSPYTLEDLELARERASLSTLLGGSLASIGLGILTGGLLSNRSKRSTP